MPATSPHPDRPPSWRRIANPYALALALLVHVVLLSSAMRWQSQRPPATKPRPPNTEVVLLLPKPPEPAVPRPEPAPELRAERPPERLAAEPPPKAALTREAIEPPANSPAPGLAMAEALPAPPRLVAAGGAGTAATGKGGGGKLFEECADAPDRRMVADVYRLRSGAASVAEMQGRTPLKTVCLAQLDITPRSFREGFPGLGDVIEWFGLDIRFTVDVAETGTWDVMLLSDDGAILTIDGVEVINNDGIHAANALEATVRMPAGQRNFRVRYFQGPREGIALMLAWKRPGAADYQYLPLRLIGRPPAAS